MWIFIASCGSFIACMDSVVVGLVLPKHVGSSWTRDGPFIPCIARRILKHWTTSESESRSVGSVVSDSFRPRGQWGQLSPWNSLGHNTGVGSLSLFQGIFPTQGSNTGIPHCRQILYQLSHKGSPRILE